MPLPKRYQKLVGSRWTSAVEVLGWRHFEVLALERRDGGYQARLAATCDAGARTYVSVSTLMDRAQWTPGWLPLSQLRAQEESGKAGPDCGRADG